MGFSNLFFFWVKKVQILQILTSKFRIITVAVVPDNNVGESTTKQNIEKIKN